MGDVGIPREKILVAFFQDLAPDVLEELRAKFRGREVSSVTLKRGEAIPSGEFYLCINVIYYIKMYRTKRVRVKYRFSPTSKLHRHLH
jgi:hypothetical protein